MGKERTPHDGLPFYCVTCGAGYAEFMACEGNACRLESESIAKKRGDAHRRKNDNDRPDIAKHRPAP